MQQVRKGANVKYRIKPKATGLEIEVTQVEGKEPQLLAAFQECQEGRCSCPSAEYEKLDSLRIVPDEGKIVLELQARAGQSLDSIEIERCLDHTAASLRKVE